MGLSEWDFLEHVGGADSTPLSPQSMSKVDEQRDLVGDSTRPMSAVAASEHGKLSPAIVINTDMTSL